MNANELAQELEVCSEFFEDRLYKKAATMLRQQQVSLVSDVEVIERLYKEIQIKDEAIFNSQKQAYNLAMQTQNQQALIEQLKKTQDYLYKTHDADKAEIEALKFHIKWLEGGAKLDANPVAWMLKTGHGTKILEKKPYCAVDYWQGLYTQNQLNEAVLLERESCAKLCESSSERDKITALIGSGYAHNIRNQK